MKISIEANVLAGAMRDAAAIVQTTNTIPICANVRLIADGGKLHIKTCDLDMEYCQTVALDGATAKFSTTVDARKLLAVANSAPTGAVLNISVGDGKMSITAGRSRWSLMTLSAKDFPEIPMDGKKLASMDIQRGALSGAIGRAKWAISTEKTRYYLNGIYMHSHGEELCFAATNGHGCMVIETSLLWPSEAPPIIVPTKLCETLAKLAGDGDEIVSLTWDDRKFRATFGEVEVTGKLIDGTFPDYRRVIPAAENTVTLDPATMGDALKRILIVRDGKTALVKIARDDGKLVVSSSSTDGDTSDEDVASDCAAGFETGANGNYMMQLLSAIGGDTIGMSQAVTGAPMLFKRTIDDGATAVLMPMRI